MTSMGRRQLLLPFPHAPVYDPRDFLPAPSNQQALAWLDAAWPDRRLALWGPAGCGKSHLLHIWAQRINAQMSPGQTPTVKMLAGPMLTDQLLRELATMSPNGALALDDADTVTSERLLLHLLNLARDRALHVLLAAPAPPSRWPIQLPDLSSRLRVITAVEIQPPSDDLRAMLLMHLLAERQLAVAHSVQNWLLAHLPRSPAALRQAVASLDRASLERGKPISRLLVASVLSGNGFELAGADNISNAAIDSCCHTPSFL